MFSACGWGELWAFGRLGSVWATTDGWVVELFAAEMLDVETVTGGCEDGLYAQGLGRFKAGGQLA